jgi:biopolymer transport protein ExbD
MIDTVFFLLVFFMITSLSMVALRAKRVTLPESETADLKPRKQITVTVARDGTHYLDEQKVSESDLLPRLSSAVEDKPDIQVVLNVDKSLPVTFFLRAFDLAKRANAGQIMVATAPRDIQVARP